MYLDTDVHIKISLEDILDGYNDSLVLTFEDVHYVNFFNDNYRLGDRSLLHVNVSNRVCVDSNDTYDSLLDQCVGIRRYKDMDHAVRGIGKKSTDVILTSWIIFSKPRHFILKEVLVNIAEMVHYEFDCESVLNSSKLTSAFPMQRLFSITGPWALTATVRDIIHKNASMKEELRVVDGVNFFKWYPLIRHDQKRSYFKIMKQKQQRLLHSYRYNEDNCSSLAEFSLQ